MWNGQGWASRERAGQAPCDATRASGEYWPTSWEEGERHARDVH